MRKLAVFSLLISMGGLAGCSDDDLIRFQARSDSGVSPSNDDGMDDAGIPAFYVPNEPGICELPDCPDPLFGIKCCTPDARCGYDPTGQGVGCIGLPGPPAEPKVCRLDDCPDVEVGNKCCTPLGDCGSDPFLNNLLCFPTAEPPPAIDGGPPYECDLDACDAPEVGVPCCAADDECGVDVFGVGICAPLSSIPDGGIPDPTVPPDDPHVTGQCPSYLGAFGPIWGCCSDFGVCGTFAFDTCLLEVGAQIPVPGVDSDDAGIAGLCTPPDLDE